MFEFFSNCVSKITNNSTFYEENNDRMNVMNTVIDKTLGTQRKLRDA